MTVAISMPWYRVPEDLFRQAVASALAQTHRDLRLVVIGDGEQPPALPKDPRIVRYTLPDNRGPYFAHQLVLLASPHEWFAVHDADDWTDPDHLERLLAFACDVVVPGRVWWHEMRFRKPHRPYVRSGRWHYGLFRRATMLSVGGYDPSRRIANDNHTLRTLALVTDVRKSTHPTYHRMKRRGSLTSTPATSMMSKARQAERAHNRAILDACRGKSASAIRDYREARVPTSVRWELDSHVGTLRGLLS